ncbi:MAG: hypothetical protein KAI17_09175, partial [Thiotrichaceae bacterium]|nr:hypothetical protein [Thiotrichaceae bacterium]
EREAIRLEEQNKARAKMEEERLAAEIELAHKEALKAEVPREEAIKHTEPVQKVKEVIKKTYEIEIDNRPTADNDFDIWWYIDGKKMKKNEDEELAQFVNRVSRAAWHAHYSSRDFDFKAA